MRGRSGILLWSSPLAVSLFFVAAIAGQGPPLVLILAGQSNMAGQGITAELPAEFRSFPPKVRYFVGMREMTPSATARFGPEISLAWELARALPDRDIVLVKHAPGGSSLLAWAPVWDSARADLTRNAPVGPLYQQLMAFVRQLPIPSDAEIGGVLWMQGERDARFPVAGQEYFQNLTELIGAFRRDLNRPELPLFLGLINPPAEAYPARELVRGSQRRAAKEILGVYLIETDDLTKHPDNVHYDTQGVLSLGQRFGRTFLAALSSGPRQEP